MQPSDDFSKWAEKVLFAAVKFKKVMRKKGLTSAKTKCPLCETGHLHGRISGPRHHFSMKCDNCTAWMME